ncbi:uncharacterized protein LOC143540095 [Bidens hawaiensis]|uniref:uncharacterized protein LOC143540095 n=1 Tax=Bidens hawaiensis TaxID=980011 RepID=UPI00404A7209
MVKNKQLTAKFIAKDLLPLFKAKPLWKGKEIQDAVKEKYKVLIHKWLAYNAKHCAFKMLHGSMREHYSKIGSYLAALKQINPTSTFNLVTAPPGFNTQDPGSNLETFFRLFVCFDGVKRGFLEGCRKILCLDGCFLKTFLGGMLLVAIGRYANDQMYPVAWAVVEGLVNAVYLIWKNAEHRNCARHIFANWKKKFKGKELKTYYWQTCRAYNEPDFNDAIKEMRAISNDAVDDFMKQNPNCFVRCFLKGNTCCDVIVSNMAETFNGTIVEARAMHIIDMLESIRLTTMTRIITKHSEMLAEDVVVCPRIQKKLDRAKKWAHKCAVFPSAYNVFQVKDFADDLAVDLNNRICLCRKWDLTVAGFLRRNAEQFVSDCYLKDTYLRSNSYTIPPLPSERYWPKVDYPLDPPPIKSQPGRPKTKRKKDPHEDPKNPCKLIKHGGEMSCSNCKESGHNIRTCTKPKTSKNQATSETVARGRSTRSTQATLESQPTQQSTGSKRPRRMTNESSQPTQQSTSSKRPRGNTKAKGKGKAT